MLLRDIQPGDTLALRRRGEPIRLVLILRAISLFQVEVLESGAVTSVPCTWLSPAAFAAPGFTILMRRETC